MKITIESLGYYVPPTVQTAAELAPLVGKSEAWIRDHTGVAERRVAHERMDVMGAKAARMALGDGPPPDLVINASLSPVQLIPDSSCFIMRELGFEGIPGFSVHSTCMSFLTALHTASALITSGAYKRILIVSSEQGTMSRDFEHPESAVLIGDGAGAAIVTATSEDGEGELLAYRMETYPSGAHLASFPGAGTRNHPNAATTLPEHNRFRMHGPGIYKKAVLKAARMIRDLLAESGLTGDDIDLVVPHQTSGPGLAAIPRFSELPGDRTVNIISEYGNCIAASLPMALAIAHERGQLKRGQRIFMLGTGAGLSVSGAILRF